MLEGSICKGHAPEISQILVVFLFFSFFEYDI